MKKKQVGLFLVALLVLSVVSVSCDNIANSSSDSIGSGIIQSENESSEESSTSSQDDEHSSASSNRL